MSQSVIKTEPINIAGLYRLKVVPPRAKELLDMVNESIKSEVERDEKILDIFNELADETTELMKKKGISLTVEDFLKERER